MDAEGREDRVLPPNCELPNDTPSPELSWLGSDDTDDSDDDDSDDVTDDEDISESDAVPKLICIGPHALEESMPLANVSDDGNGVDNDDDNDDDEMDGVKEEVE